MKHLFVGLVAILAVAPVSAQCRTVVHQQQHVNAAAVVVPVVNTVFVPAYFAGYTPTPEPQAPAQKMTEADAPAPDVAAILAEIRDALKRIEARIGSGGATTPAPAPPTDVTKTAMAAIASSCNKCHNAATSESKGGGFTMVERDGTLSILGVKDKARIAARVQKGQMPPPPATLAAADKAALVSYFGGKK